MGRSAGVQSGMPGKNHLCQLEPVKDDLPAMLHSLVGQRTVLTAQAIQARHSKLPICRTRGSQHVCAVTLVLYLYFSKARLCVSQSVRHKASAAKPPGEQSRPNALNSRCKESVVISTCFLEKVRPSCPSSHANRCSAPTRSVEEECAFSRCSIYVGWFLLAFEWQLPPSWRRFQPTAAFVQTRVTEDNTAWWIQV